MLHVPSWKVARLETELSIVKKEKVEVDKINGAKIKSLEKRCEELSRTNSKLGADLSYAEERFKVLDSNTAGYKKEAERLRERLAKAPLLSFTSPFSSSLHHPHSLLFQSDGQCGKQEQKIMDITQRLMDMQDELSKVCFLIGV